MSHALRNLQLTASYEDLQLLVYKVTQNFAIKYNLRFDDLIGESHCIFVKEFDRYMAHSDKQPEGKRAALSSWIYQKLVWGMISYLRKEYRHMNLGNLEDAPEPCCTPNLFMAELRSELSEEANKIVSIILDTPKDFQLLLSMGRANTKTRYVRILRERLQDSGWDDEEIEKYLSEITAVINGEAVEVEEPEPIEPGSFWDESDLLVLERCGFVERDEVRAMAESPLVLLKLGLTRQEVRALLS